MFRIRPMIGVGAVLVAAAASCLDTLEEARQLDPSYRHADILAEYDQQRLREVRPLLARDATVAYVEDAPVAAHDLAVLGYVVQYALCPTVVDIATRPHPYRLVNEWPGAEPNTPQPGQLLYENAGTGVRLYRTGER